MTGTGGLIESPNCWTPPEIPDGIDLKGRSTAIMAGTVYALELIAHMKSHCTSDIRECLPAVAKSMMERYAIGCRHRDCLNRIREIQQAIVTTKAHTVAGAAVPLRRCVALRPC